MAAALRHIDPALLRYRSGGFYLQSAAQVPGHDAVRDVLLGLVGASCEPVSGGRLLFVCEDNGIGISVRTPAGWIEAAYGNRPGLAYFAADGCDLADAVHVSRQAAHYVRVRRRPAFLHLRTVRLMGHAGSDAESAYRSLLVGGEAAPLDDGAARQGGRRGQPATLTVTFRQTAHASRRCTRRQARVCLVATSESV